MNIQTFYSVNTRKCLVWVWDNNVWWNGKWQTLGHNDQVRLTTRLSQLISVIQEFTQLDISSTDDRQSDP